MALAGLNSYGPAGRMVEPMVEKVRQEKKNADSGVSFHFYGGSSAASTAPTRKNRLALTAAAEAPAPQFQTSHAMVVPARSSAALDPKYTVLANQLGDIEKLIDGIENCLSASTFPSLAPVVLGELDLLKGSTKQIRTNGTTLILAEVGRPPTEVSLSQHTLRASLHQFDQLSNSLFHLLLLCSDGVCASTPRDSSGRSSDTYRGDHGYHPGHGGISEFQPQGADIERASVESPPNQPARPCQHRHHVLNTAPFFLFS